MLALPKGDEEEFIDSQAAAGKSVEKQSAREVQRNVKAFKQQRDSKKSADDDKLTTLQGLGLPLDVPNDTPPDLSVTTNPEFVDDLYDNRADVLAEETDDNPDIVNHDVASDTLPAVYTIPTPINASADMVVATPVKVIAVNSLIAETNDPQQLQAIRVSLTATLASPDAKLDAIAQKN